MNVDVIRKIDYWVGVPACFLLTLFRKLFGSSFRDRGEVKSVVFFQISEMGSAVSAYPSVKYVKDNFPGATIYYVMFRKLRSIVDLLGIVDKENVLTIRDDNIINLIKDTLSVIFKLRGLKVDAGIDLELFSRFSAILSFMSNSNIRIGFDKFKMEGLYRGDLQTHSVIYNCYKHIGYNYFTLVKTIDQGVERPYLKEKVESYTLKAPLIESSNEEKESILNKLRDISPDINFSREIVIVNPNASQLLPLRRWPIEHYVELVKKILADLDVIVVITGLASEKPDAMTISNAVNNSRCIDFTGKTDLKSLIDLFNVSRLLVSNDSGPPNFASLTNIDIVVFFGPETPLLYQPLGRHVKVFYSGYACSPCVSAYNHRQSPCKHNKCLSDISPDDVFSYVRQTLEK